jgi:hypothetical protein
MNIVVAAKPLYKVDEWLLDYLDGKAEDIYNAHLALITETRPGIPLQHLHMLKHYYTRFPHCDLFTPILHWFYI